MRFGVDYSFGRPDLAALKAAGKSFVCRYLSGGHPGKDLTVPELAALRAAGIDVVTVWETTAERPLGGFDRGIADASAASVQVESLLGNPPHAPIYFAVDFGPSGQQLPAVMNYIDGAASVLGRDRTGVYGSFGVVEAALDLARCRYAWQTYAWSHGAWDPRAQLRQVKNGVIVGGAEVDLDEAHFDDFGQWNWNEDDMVTDDDLNRISAAVLGRFYGEYLARAQTLGFRPEQTAGAVGAVAEAKAGDIQNLIGTLVTAVTHLVSGASPEAAQVLAAIPTAPEPPSVDAILAALDNLPREHVHAVLTAAAEHLGR